MKVAEISNTLTYDTQIPHKSNVLNEFPNLQKLIVSRR